MSLFKYKATDKNKKTITGLVEAANENSAAEILKDKGLIIVTIEPQSTIGRLRQLPIFYKVKIKDVVIFSRQFAVLISANVAIVQTLRILVNQTANRKLKAIVAEIADEVDGGSKLSDALAKRPKVFSGFFINAVKSGESSGKLDEVLTYLADEMEKDYDMLAKIKGAMIYPAFVLIGLTGVGVLMMVVVVPKLTALMIETGAELPMATRILIGVSNILKSYWWALSFVILGLFIGFKVSLRNPQVKNIVDSLKLRIPVFGRLFRLIYLVRFTRAFGMLIASGVSMTTSLKVTADVVGNNVFKNLIDKTVIEVEDGNSITTVFLESKQIPVMVSQMMNVGEETGKLDTILGHITEFFAREIKNTLANLMTLMEPVIMVIMGVAVGIMVAAVIMPMYNMASQF